MTHAWTGQVALVTGGGRGLGRATVRALAARGVAVGVNYATRADAAEALVAEISAAGGRAVAVGGDVADAGAVGAMVARVEETLGPISILVNNAGIGWASTIEGWNAEGYARLHAVNVEGVIHGVRAVVGGMKARGYGRIVNIASVAGFATSGFPGNHFYAGTKAEVMALTKRFAFELGAHGVTVNAVAPGFVRTDMTQGGKTAAEWSEIEANFSGRAMTGRVGEPEAGWITAQVIAVDGGRMDYIGHG
jgi:NAD(P)-dependent dehydrogenase (short-subunit alcohol dehydrogenase family)